MSDPVINSVKNLGASYDATGTTQFLLVTDVTDIVSVTYYISPAGNASSGSDTEIVTKTVLVGSPQCVNTSDNNYLVFVEEDARLCNDDYLVIFSARNADGNSAYTTPSTIYLAPKTPEIDTAVLDRNGSAGYEDGVLTVILKEDVTECNGVDKNVDIYFIIQFQLSDTGEYTVVREKATQDTGNAKKYTADVDALATYGIVDDTLYVATQAVREVTEGSSTTTSSSELSDTVLAIDVSEQQPPTNFAGTYNNAANEGDGQVDLTFNNPTTWQLITPAAFNIYKKSINANNGETIQGVLTSTTFVTGSSHLYEVTDSSANFPVTGGAVLPIGSTIIYSATAIDSDGNESRETNEVSFGVIIASSEPRNLTFTALIEDTGSGYDETTNLSLFFREPSDIQGEVDDEYEPAYWLVQATSSEGNLGTYSHEFQYVDFNDPTGGFINIPINNLPEVNEREVITLTVSLVTWDSTLTQYIVGAEAEETQIALSRPVITDFTDAAGDVNQSEFKRDDLASFAVYSYGQLVTPGVQVITQKTDGDFKIYEGIELDEQRTTVPGGYNEYALADKYQYTVDGKIGSGEIVVSIHASNADGMSGKKASDLA
ncbi:MAG: hypothetical protein CMC04_03275 [Flavobacteriaceae bacterium]|nr:hypothetical protein [Flavobacteriaceae bacterium]|tara:strand:- start:1001 stop:2803 length:1803 start_codon:yes stop_codon:yes gene_type:complete